MTTGYYPDHGAPLGQLEAEPTHAGEGESVEELRAARERAEGRVEGMKEALEKTAAAKAPPKLDPSRIPPPDPGPMPDIQTDPEAYQEWALKTRELDRWEAKHYTDTREAAATSAIASDRIMDGYMASRPKYQALRPYVFQAFKEVCASLQLKELPEDPTALNAAVDLRMKELVKAAAAAVDDLPTGDPNTEPGRKTPPGRTGDLSAGSRGAASSGTPPKDEDSEPIKSLRDVLLERQAASGLF